MSVKISKVIPESICDKKGVKSSWELVSINKNDIIDVLDYQYYIAETKLRVVFKSDEHRYHVLCLKKNQYEDIGLEFDTYLMDSQRSCTNNCIFCFVDQTPPNMRETLYFKDDDARLSFLFGNYITLTNLKQEEVDRIIKMKISPINISVHSTDKELRCRMMGNRFAGEKLEYLKQLTDSGITVNCQFVMCRDINDGIHLKRSLKDLSELYPNVQSIACVPVGLTKYRENLFPLKSYDEDSAKEVIEIIEDFSNEFYQKNGTRLAYASDEFYLLAKKPLPDEDFYEDYAQLENGVGVISMLNSDFDDMYNQIPEDEEYRDISIATGIDAAPFIEKLVTKAKRKWKNLNCTVYAVVNDFWGEHITVAGLVTATDIIKQLKDKDLGQTLILPSCMLRHEKDKFLDDLTIDDVEKALGIKVTLTETEGDSLLTTMLSIIKK